MFHFTLQDKDIQKDKCALLGKGVCNLVFCVYACTGMNLQCYCNGMGCVGQIAKSGHRIIPRDSKIVWGGYRQISLRCFVLSVEALCVLWSYFPDYLLYPAYATALLYYMTSLMHTLEIQKETAQC